MTIGRRGYCPGCGNQLRRGQSLGTLCDSCLRGGPDPARELPADFFFRDPMRAALGEYDFGAVFLETRGHTGWSQRRLGRVVDLDQSQISALERGRSRLWHVRLVAGIARGLRIPPALLNFPNIGVTVGATGIAVRKDVSWVDRRDFGGHVAGLVLGVAAAAGLDLDRLFALLPQAEPTGTRQIGVADVEVLEQLTAMFRSQDFAGRSGLARDAAVAQVQAALPLLGAQIAEELRPRLRLAVAELAAQAGWMGFVANQHEAARRLWIIGLNLARAADHPQATDLTVYLLADMALQAVHLGRPPEAVHLGRIGDTAAIGRHPVSESTTGLLANIQAQTYAAYGDAKACERACGQATEHFSNIDPAAAPPWTAYLSETGGSGEGGQGSAYYELARPGRDPVAAGRAVSLLSQTVERLGPGYARLQARYLPDLAGSHALAGDVGTAVTLGHQAIELISTLSSSPSSWEGERLRILNTVLEPLLTSPGVAELRDRLTMTAV
ncbi:MAG: helix-turn-helix domain-containing protein [Pseudonocardiaceae bacterium]